MCQTLCFDERAPELLRRSSRISLSGAGAKLPAAGMDVARRLASASPPDGVPPVADGTGPRSLTDGAGWPLAGPIPCERAKSSPEDLVPGEFRDVSISRPARSVSREATGAKFPEPQLLGTVGQRPRGAGRPAHRAVLERVGRPDSCSMSDRGMIAEGMTSTGVAPIDSGTAVRKKLNGLLDQHAQRGRAVDGLDEMPVGLADRQEASFKDLLQLAQPCGRLAAVAENRCQDRHAVADTVRQFAAQQFAAIRSPPCGRGPG